MSEFGFFSQFMSGKRPKLSKAYCEGRAASYAGAAITTNPHGSGTPEWNAWRNGHVTYASAGANTWQDVCDRPMKFANLTIAAAVDASDPSGATWKFTPSAPGLPFTLGFGDGFGYENPAASVAVIQHKYKASGSYLIRMQFADKVWDPKTISVFVA